MKHSFDAQREVLRLRLQAQRHLLGSSQSGTLVYDNNYPRSITMSLLSGRSSVAAWAVMELLPLLVLHFLGHAGQRLRSGS
jgi:hypothetical protein